MPRRSEKDTVEPVTPNKKAVNKRLRVGANGHKLPEALPPGVVLFDVMKRKWKLGKSIGSGGFGEIYLVSEDSPAVVGPNALYVVKIEHHTNGPLFAEMHFYHRVGKEENIQEWMKKKKLTFLGMPRFVASGSHEHKGIKYRFMVMDRFGEDLQKILDRCQRIFPQKTVYTLGVKILDILEYIHSYGYIHADVKASNLLLGFGKGNENKVFLIDFGLACRYVTDGKHKEYKPDLRKAHDGTIEFTSRDAHIGAHSRRGDLEILGYNMLQWLCGRLPWEDNLKVPDYVKEQKCGYMLKIPEFMTNCFNGKYPEGIAEYLQYIANLQFHEEPDYEQCRNILRNAIKKAGAKLDGKLVFNSPKKSPVRATGSKCNKRAMNYDDSCGESPPGNRKMKRGTPKMPSENHSNVTPPTPKHRKPHSAAPGLQSAKSTENCFGSMFDNPTPAMLLVMQRKLQLQQEEQMKKKVKPCVMDESESKSPEFESPERLRRSPRTAKENLVYKGRSPVKKIVRRKSPALRSRSNSYSPEV